MSNKTKNANQKQIPAVSITSENTSLTFFIL